MGYYYEKPGVIKVEFLDKKAEEQANNFVVRYFNRKKQKDEVDQKKSLSSAQMRRFFSEFRQLEKKVKAEGFERVMPLIKMVKSKACYAANRPTPIPITFKNFIVHNVDQINDEEDFKAFVLHFEAVVGFFYGIPGIRNN